MGIGDSAGQRLNDLVGGGPKRITIGEKGPGGGGNFNPDVKIDTSHVTVAPT